jgi:hypothetical protein
MERKIAGKAPQKNREASILGESRKKRGRRAIGK